ncbi:MAG: hypothetical protein HUJ53_10850, partial [Holdemanella sp.]|nr:hypothetical protein [Holdemanella sp.]
IHTLLDGRDVPATSALTYIDALEDLLWVKLGSKNDYYSISKLDNLAVFMRSIVGIDQEAINDKFGKYLSENFLSAEQMEFIKSVICYVQENGDITGETVVEESPFDSFDPLYLFGDKAFVLADVVEQLHDCIERA